MEYFSQEHSKLLLNKEWLVKIDSEKSVPYLLKVYCSTVDLCCYVLITDTKNTWGEVLQSNQLGRRWRDCNPLHAPSSISNEDEDEWRTEIVELLSAAHSLGGIADLSFEIVGSHYADFAFELASDTFKWRWETCIVGPRLSAEILSKHLIMPMISLTHLAFSSADPVSELLEVDLEKAVDKVGRTARRTIDTHVKHAMSRPRAATTLRRMTAMFNFFPDLPPVLSDVQKPDLRPPSMRPKSRAASKTPQRPIMPLRVSPAPAGKADPRATTKSPGRNPSPPRPKRTQPAADDSETESEDDLGQGASGPSGSSRATDRASQQKGTPSSPRSRSPVQQASRGSRQPTPEPRETSHMTPGPSADASSPASSPPAKKPKRVQSSDEDDSEAERRRRVTQIKSNVNRGAKQPLKRGRRF